MRAFLNRPDHLTRAAMELSTLSEVERTTRDLSLSPSIVVTSISTGAHAQPAIVVSPEEAKRINLTIGETIARVRAIEASPAADR